MLLQKKNYFLSHNYTYINMPLCAVATAANQKIINFHMFVHHLASRIVDIVMVVIQCTVILVTHLTVTFYLLCCNLQHLRPSTTYIHTYDYNHIELVDNHHHLHTVFYCYF